MNPAQSILRLAGWSVDISVPDFPKCLICVAPHTSNWDFIMGKLAYAAVHRHAGFLMKSTWFFPPLGWCFRAMGGIPVYRSKNSDRPSMVEQIIEIINRSTRIQIAITPEGTRSRTAQWHTGMLHIARATDIPIVLATIDYKHRRIIADTHIFASDDTDADMRLIKSHYDPSQARFPEKFDNK